MAKSSEPSPGQPCKTEDFVSHLRATHNVSPGSFSELLKGGYVGGYRAI